MMKKVSLYFENGLYRITSYNVCYTKLLRVHGWMHGDVIDEPRGEKGFGYDPMFIPTGYDRTLGELDDKIKEKISHRGQALALAKPIIAMLKNK